MIEKGNAIYFDGDCCTIYDKNNNRRKFAIIKMVNRCFPMK